jgi:hypothetical protein
MAKVAVQCFVSDADALEALREVTDYRRWPDASESVREVVVKPEDDGSSTSSWKVTFRGGLMQWSERDRFDDDALVHSFDLVEGDPHGFSGTWTAEARDRGCELRMDAEFDLGMPSLGHVLDPIAVEALEDAVADVVRNLFGDKVRVAFGELATT